MGTTATRNNELYDEVQKKCENVMSISNVSKETQQVLSMIPLETHKKKVELIYAATDMSTAEKLAALNREDDKYINNMERVIDKIKGWQWEKIAMFLVASGTTIVVSTPQGKKYIKTLVEKIV